MSKQWFIVGSVTPMARWTWPPTVDEAPTNPFAFVTPASEQETGLFARIALPRMAQDHER